MSAAHALAFLVGVLATLAFVLWLGRPRRRGGNSIEPVRENVVAVLNGKPVRPFDRLRARLGWRP